MDQSNKTMNEVERKQKSSQNTALAVAMITNFFSPFGASALNIAVPHIGTEYHSTAVSLPWIVISYVLTTALLSIPFGRVADIYGRKPILKIGIFLFFVASLLNIFSPNIQLFFLFRVLQGIGAAMTFATNTAILIDVYPASNRGSVLGITVAAVYTGHACGPVIGGLLTHTFGWRAIFIVLSLLAFIALIISVTRFSKDEEQGATQKLNSSSIVLFISSLGLLMYGLVTFAQHIWSYCCLAAGAVLIVIFIKHEMRTEVPVIEVRLFSGNMEFSLSTLAALFNFASMYAITYLMSLYLQLARGFTADISGLILISQPIVQIVLSPIAGRLSDKRSPATIASIGMACCTGALFMFSFLDEHTPILFLIAGLLLTGVGVGLFSSPNSNVILGSVSNKDYGVASSVLSTSRTVGQVVGMAILTIVINKVIGNISIEHVTAGALVRDTHISYLIFTVICGIGILFSLKRRGKKEEGLS